MKVCARKPWSVRVPRWTPWTAEQELLDARVQLVQAQRNEMVAAFSVLSATGQLSARLLGLRVPYYDHEKHYKQVRDKWWGTDINE